jgi:hypothetical protein
MKMRSEAQCGKISSKHCRASGSLLWVTCNCDSWSRFSHGDSSSPLFRRWRKVDEKESTRSLDGSETPSQSSRLLFMRTAGHGGCSPGRRT